MNWLTNFVRPKLRALVARNWVRSLVSVDLSLKVSGSVDVSDGFAMTGAIVFSGGRVFVVADPATGFGFGVDATGTQTLNNLKFTAPSIAEWGDRLLTGGTPPACRGPARRCSRAMASVVGMDFSAPP